jgi:hypothetical protein
MDYCLAIENCSSNYGRKICAKTASAKSPLLKMSTVSVFPILTAAIVQMSVALETPSLDPKNLRTLLTVVVQQFEQPKNHFSLVLFCHFSQVARANQLVGKHP